jgi:hypothetical protein
MIRAVAVILVVSFVLVMTSRSAFAADDPTCIQAYEQTQALRKASRLRQAREQAALCARDSCAAVLAKDCAKWFTELEQSIPTVTFQVRGPDGNEATKVRVSMDGQVIAERLEGKSVPVDIGAHTFKFELLEGKGGVAEKKAIINEGDKNRKIEVEIRGAEHAVEARPIPISVWVTGIISVAALGGGIFMALDGSSQESDLEACKPACQANSVNKVQRRYAAADILFTTSALTAIGAVYLYLTRPTVRATEAAFVDPPKKRRPVFGVGVRPEGGASASFALTF